MVPFLTSPFALLALLAVPALVAIYLFQRRFRVREVSSLILWDAIRQPASGGRKRERLQLPLTFWLELLAIALLALAAAGPLLPRWSRSRPLVIVCDDSLSMQAGGAREKAIAFAKSELAKRKFSPVRIVIAGATPRFERDFAQWTCTSQTSDLDAAIALAASAAGRNALVLVLTDHAPDAPLEAGRIRWQAFGAPLRNLGFVAAARTGNRVLLEIAEGSSTSRRVDGSSSGAVDDSKTRRPGGLIIRRRQLSVPDGPYEATLNDDAAAFDNRVVLLPDRRPPLRVALRVQDATIESALRATSRVTLDDVHPQLVVTDHESNDEWSVEVQHGSGGAAFVGPYVIDRTNALTTGLHLDGIVWGAARGAMPGQPVVLAGDQPLVSVDGKRVRIRFDRTISNLHHAPAWPALWWNIVEWRAAQLPGLRSANVSLGANAFVNLETPNAIVTAPDQTQRTVSGPSAVIAATQPGIWRVGPYSFGCNALAPEETDLSHNRSGGWGTWNDEALTSAGFENVAWILLLIALAALIAHQRVTRGALAT